MCGPTGWMAGADSVVWRGAHAGKRNNWEVQIIEVQNARVQGIDGGGCAQTIRKWNFRKWNSQNL